MVNIASQSLLNLIGEVPISLSGSLSLYEICEIYIFAQATLMVPFTGAQI